MRATIPTTSVCPLRAVRGGKSLRRAVMNYVEHFHTERNHQGLGNAIIQPGDEVGEIAGTVKCQERLGGLLKYYHREAA